MLITFKCHAAPDVKMLKDHASYLLAIVGKQLGERGVIAHDEVPGAITRLEGAIAEDRQKRAESEGHFHEDDPDRRHHEIPVGLAQRAFPFLDMLRAARNENADIVWGM
jgi:hypothetical protein